MPTIFEYINSILFSKKKLDINMDDNTYSSFMINRWASMYSAEMCYFINKTTNFRLDKIFGNSKEDQYKFLLNLIPKLKYSKINYLKKSKKETIKQTNKDNGIEINLEEAYANNYELSQREIKEYLKLLKDLGIENE